MELSNTFRVGVSVPEAWKVLTDVERIAPMLPGAQLQEIEGEEYRGVVKVKVGPITAQYKGQATFLERDEAAGKVVLRATGRDTRGQGNASAVITATMSPDGDATKVTVVTDMTITGKVAQFGRGVLAEVSSKLIGQFVDALEADLINSRSGAAGGAAEEAAGGDGEGGTASSGDTQSDAGEAPEAAGAADTATTAAGNGAAAPQDLRRVSGPEVEPVDLISVAGGSTLKRLAPIAGLLVVVVIIVARRRAKQARRQARLTARLPDLSGPLQSVGELTGRLPELAGHLPSVGELTGRLPELAGHLPSVGELTGRLPELAGHLPSVGELTGRLPELAGHLPSVGELTGRLPDFAGHMPEVRVPDVRSAVRRHRRGR